MKTEIKILRFVNPFTGGYEDLICTLELHFLKSALVTASITKVVSNDGDDILEWLNNEKLEEMEREFVEGYGK